MSINPDHQNSMAEKLVMLLNTPDISRSQKLRVQAILFDYLKSNFPEQEVEKILKKLGANLYS